MRGLNETQRKALELVRSSGTLYAGKGVSLATIAVLERHGLVVVARSRDLWGERKVIDWHAMLADTKERL